MDDQPEIRTGQDLQRFPVLLQQYPPKFPILLPSYLEISLMELRFGLSKVLQSPVHLPENLVQPFHKICTAGIHLDSAEILTYQVAHLVKAITEEVPLRPDKQQVGLEDPNILESSDRPHYTGATSQVTSTADRW